MVWNFVEISISGLGQRMKQADSESMKEPANEIARKESVHGNV